MILKIKPLSVNQAFQGKKYKTPKYVNYERAVMFMLKKMEIPEGKLEINYKVGYSNTQSDIDNFVKPLTDILQKKYKFNDNRIYRMNIVKEIVKKGDEFIEFEIKKIEQ